MKIYVANMHIDEYIERYSMQRRVDEDANTLYREDGVEVAYKWDNGWYVDLELVED